jgi:hypothetical protein
MQASWLSNIGAEYNKVCKYLTGPWKPISLPLKLIYVYLEDITVCFGVCTCTFRITDHMLRYYTLDFFRTCLWHKFKHLCNVLIFFHVPQQTRYKTPKVLVAWRPRYMYMYMYMYMCMCMCICRCRCRCIYVCIYIYMYVYVYMYVYMYMYIPTWWTSCIIHSVNEPTNFELRRTYM